jgi:hypothetical protein
LKNKKNIHFPLVGTGGLGFSSEDGIDGLLDALFIISELNRKDFPSFYLYVPDDDKYDKVIQRVTDRIDANLPPSSKEAKK